MLIKNHFHHRAPANARRVQQLAAGAGAISLIKIIIVRLWARK